jgi:hypothetical protein
VTHAKEIALEASSDKILAVAMNSVAAAKAAKTSPRTQVSMNKTSPNNQPGQNLLLEEDTGYETLLSFLF